MIEYGPITRHRYSDDYLASLGMSTSLATDKFKKTSLSFYDYLTRPDHPTPETRGFYCYHERDSDNFVITHHKELTNW